jgi:hypothetical protein
MPLSKRQVSRQGAKSAKTTGLAAGFLGGLGAFRAITGVIKR